MDEKKNIFESLDDFKIFLVYWTTKPTYDGLFGLPKDSQEYYSYRSSLLSKEMAFFHTITDIRVDSLKKMIVQIESNG